MYVHAGFSPEKRATLQATAIVSPPSVNIRCNLASTDIEY